MRNVRNTGGRKMKSYLDLVRIQSGYRRNENRMTRLCIFLAVFLVTVIFGMADMEIRTQKVQTILSGGGWHGVFGEITPEQMDLIASRPETDVAVRCAMLNSGLDQGYQIQGTETGIFGIEETFSELFPGFEITEGICPENHRQAVITEKLGERLGKKTGDTVTVTLPDGTAWDFTICGMVGEASMLGDQENDLHHIFRMPESGEGTGNSRGRQPVCFFFQQIQHSENTGGYPGKNGSEGGTGGVQRPVAGADAAER